MKHIKYFAVMLLAIFGAVAFAQVVAVPAPPTYLDGILAWVKGNGGMIASAMAVLEVILRLVPSAKALSILVPVRYACDGIAYLLTQLSSLLGMLVSSLNNTTAPAVSAPKQ